MRYVLLHVSDLHAGPPFNPALAQQLAREAHELKPDLVVISGDLVQRADFPRQWRTINATIAALPEPRLIVPGNHDVPLLNIFARIFRPLDTYRRHVTEELNPVFERPGLVVVGGVTAHGLTIDGGRLSGEQQAHLSAIFSRYADDVCKVIVLHHHVINPPGCEGRSTISNAEEVVHLLDRWGVDLLLCGHIHVSYVGTTLDVRPNLAKGTIICQSGTTTSRRGKSRERGKNSYNVIIIEDASIRIVQHLFLEELGRFAPVAEHVFPHRAAGAYTLTRIEG
jgi:3',5'-cyclic AMP phosphodiesterase CpdA